MLRCTLRKVRAPPLQISGWIFNFFFKYSVTFVINFANLFVYFYLINVWTVMWDLRCLKGRFMDDPILKNLLLTNLISIKFQKSTKFFVFLQCAQRESVYNCYRKWARSAWMPIKSKICHVNWLHFQILLLRYLRLILY